MRTRLLAVCEEYLINVGRQGEERGAPGRLPVTNYANNKKPCGNFILNNNYIVAIFILLPLSLHLLINGYLSKLGAKASAPYIIMFLAF